MVKTLVIPMICAVRKTNTESTENPEGHGEKRKMMGKSKNNSKSKILRF